VVCAEPTEAAGECTSTGFPRESRRGNHQRAGAVSGNAPHLVALVRAGARFERGKLVERGPVLEAQQATAEAGADRNPGSISPRPSQLHIAPPHPPGCARGR